MSSAIRSCYWVWWPNKEKCQKSALLGAKQEKFIFNTLKLYLCVYVGVLGSLMKALFLPGSTLPLLNPQPQKQVGFFFLIGINRLACHRELKIWSYTIVFILITVIKHFCLVNALCRGEYFIIISSPSLGGHWWLSAILQEAVYKMKPRWLLFSLTFQSANGISPVNYFKNLLHNNLSTYRLTMSPYYFQCSVPAKMPVTKKNKIK